jgi:hypothetical protein
MVDGLWTMEFMVAPNRYGSGVVVLKDGRILGGDSGYYYNGTYELIGTTLNATANIIKYNQNSISVFGNIGLIQLNFSCQIEEDYQFSGIANIVGNPMAQIRISGEKKEDWDI